MEREAHDDSTYDITRLGPRQVFHSAEHVAFEVPLAGPTSRILAYAIDAFCVSLLLIGTSILFLFFFAPALDRFSSWLQPVLEQAAQGGDPQKQAENMLWIFAALVIAQFALEWLYFIVLELTTGGRSIGKACLGLRVCLDGGLPVTPGATVMRNLLRIVDVLPVYYITGLTSMIVSREGKRLGDHAAGTIVVRLDRPPPAPPIPRREDDPDFRFERAHLAAMGAEERALLRQTLRRLEALPPAQRGEVVDRTAEVLRARLNYRALTAEERERFLHALFRAL